MRRALAVLVIVGLGGFAAEAHHSISAVYDRARQVTLRGTIVEFALVQPHPFLVIAAGDGEGAERWKGEMDNRHELVAIGVTANTLKPGDHVVVTGSAARDRSRQVYVLRLDRPTDGFWYEQVGMSPRIGMRATTP